MSFQPTKFEPVDSVSSSPGNAFTKFRDNKDRSHRQNIRSTCLNSDIFRRKRFNTHNIQSKQKRTEYISQKRMISSTIENEKSFLAGMTTKNYQHALQNGVMINGSSVIPISDSLRIKAWVYWTFHSSKGSDAFVSKPDNFQMISNFWSIPDFRNDILCLLANICYDNSEFRNFLLRSKWFEDLIHMNPPYEYFSHLIQNVFFACSCGYVISDETNESNKRGLYQLCKNIHLNINSPRDLITHLQYTLSSFHYKILTILAEHDIDTCNQIMSKVQLSPDPESMSSFLRFIQVLSTSCSTDVSLTLFYKLKEIQVNPALYSLYWNTIKCLILTVPSGILDHRSYEWIIKTMDNLLHCEWSLSTSLSICSWLISQNTATYSFVANIIEQCMNSTDLEIAEKAYMIQSSYDVIMEKNPTCQDDFDASNNHNTDDFLNRLSQLKLKETKIYPE